LDEEDFKELIIKYIKKSEKHSISMSYFDLLFKINYKEDTLVKNTLISKAIFLIKYYNLEKHFKIYSSYTHVKACEFNNLELLKFIYEDVIKNKKEFIWHSECSHKISINKNLEMLKWAEERGCILYSDCYSNAFINKDYETIKFLISKGIKLDSLMFAILSDDLEILKSAINLKHVKLDFYDLYLAIRNCDLKIVQFLRIIKPPCPWNEMTAWAAVHANKLETLKWLISNECPIDKNYCLEYCKNEKIRKWIIENV
jgi:hypothetical protein